MERDVLNIVRLWMPKPRTSVQMAKVQEILQNLHKYVMSNVGNQSDVCLCKYESLSILQKKEN